MKRIRIVLITMAALLALSVGTHAGWRYFRTWQQQNWISMARASLDRADYRNASLVARRVVESNPNHVDATRVLAELAELSRSTNALIWRKRVVELQPEAASNRMVWARSALTFEKPEVALDALKDLDATARQTPEYFNLLGKAHFGMGRIDEAETNLIQAAALDPTNLVVLADLHLVRLRSTRTGVPTLARMALETLSTNTALKPAILRQLSAEAAKRGKLQEAIRQSRELITVTTNAQDQLRHLGLLRDAQSLEFGTYLSRLQRDAGTNVFQVSLLGRWMADAHLAADCVRWIEGLPSAVRADQEVSLAYAEALLGVKDWMRLARHLGTKTWGESEYFRQLLLARIAREENNSSRMHSHWLRCLKGASGNLDALLQLIKYTQAWGWNDALDDTLIAILERFPTQRWAEDYLVRSLKQAGKTLALQNLLSKTVEREPTNVVAKCTLATAGLLLNHADKRSHKLAAEAFASESTNPPIAAAYALSLHFQNHTSEAIQILEQLPKERLETPGLAARYSLLLAASGQMEKARRYFALGQKARTLPEERRLLAQLMDGI